MQVKIVDSRFKHLAASFQHQIDELKLEFGSIHLSSNHGANYVSHNDQHEKSKRQVPIKNKDSNVAKPKQTFCAIGSSPCTFYYADNPDSNKTRLQPGVKSSNKTLPICESSSLLCNFYHPDHPNATVASRKDNNKKINNDTMISTNATTSQDQTTIVLKGKPTSSKGMPKNCTDLQLFGHSLNGFYLVAPNEESKIETVYCDFQMTLSPDLKGHI